VKGTTCPKSQPCPTCFVPAGRKCRRPSGHEAPQLHADRILAAESIDRAKGLGPESLIPGWVDDMPGQTTLEV
jgi:hypothetical protein